MTTDTRQTSLDAWDAIQSRLPRMRAFVLGLIRAAVANGATADELVASCGARHHNSIEPRLSELVATGLVVDGGRRRMTRNGQMAVVWELATTASESPRTKKCRVDWRVRCGELEFQLAKLTAENERLRALLVAH